MSLLRFSPQLGLRYEPGITQGCREAENKNSGLMSPWKSLLPEPQLWSLNIISSHSSPFISSPGEARASPWPLHVILGSRKVRKEAFFFSLGCSWQHRGKGRQALTRSGNFCVCCVYVCVWGGVDFVILLLGHTQKCSGITVSFVIKNRS